MNLVIDYGNTSAKVGIFEDDTLHARQIFKDDASLQKYLGTLHVEGAIISSVKANADAVMSWISECNSSITLDHKTALPVALRYDTPETLGVDRIAGACGARVLFPSHDALVIDAGSCLTYDLIDRNANYYGGSISPGLSMRFQSLNTFTARLPLVSPVEHPLLTGVSTAGSIQSGVINGMVFEINGVIQAYTEKYPAIKTVLCGGDAHFFENQLKASIFAFPDLVLVGLNSILKHHAQ